MQLTPIDYPVHTLGAFWIIQRVDAAIDRHESKQESHKIIPDQL